MKARHTITIDRDVYLRLKTKGFFGESYNELISRLIDFADKYKLSSKFKEDDEK
jgi:predicted CopG family antitoxin